MARDIEAHHAAADRGPERNVDLIFEIGAGFGAFLRRSPGALPSAENRAEDIAEAATPTAFTPPLRAIDEIGKIEPAKIEGNTLAPVLPPAGEAARESAAPG
jgi:hypothetical protein